MRNFLARIGRTKLPTVFALAVLLWASWANWFWIWGIFFLYWSIFGIITGQAFVVQNVYRDRNPILFWAIGLTWLILSILSILYDLIIPEFLPEWGEWLGVGYE